MEADIQAARDSLTNLIKSRHEHAVRRTYLWFAFVLLAAGSAGVYWQTWWAAFVVAAVLLSPTSLFFPPGDVEERQLAELQPVGIEHLDDVIAACELGPAGRHLSSKGCAAAARSSTCRSMGISPMEVQRLPGLVQLGDRSLDWTDRSRGFEREPKASSSMGRSYGWRVRLSRATDGRRAADVDASLRRSERRPGRAPVSPTRMRPPLQPHHTAMAGVQATARAMAALPAGRSGRMP